MSVGSSEFHRNFSWKMDDQNILHASDGKMLAAHRYFDKDKIGNLMTYVMTHGGHDRVSEWEL